jgi:hypothetical protein
MESYRNRIVIMKFSFTHLPYFIKYNVHFFRVQVNQRHVMFCFPLPARLQWLEPAGRKQKSADVEQKTYTLIYPDPLFYIEHDAEIFSVHYTCG